MPITPFNSIGGFSVGITGTSFIDDGGNATFTGLTVTGNFSVSSVVTSLNGKTGALQDVTSFNGLTGAVTGVASFNGLTGAVTGVASFNGLTGAVTGVASFNGLTGAAALTDPIIADFQQLSQVVPTIDNTNPDTIQGMQYLVSAGIITQDRYNEIMG